MCVCVWLLFSLFCKFPHACITAPSVFQIMRSTRQPLEACPKGKVQAAVGVPAKEGGKAREEKEVGCSS